jgi:hypothetical protein
MLRITYEVSQTHNVLHVEGQLRRENLAELENAVSEQSGSICLDLKNLIYADEHGILSLRTLATGGAELVNVSPLIQMLLEQPDG